MEIKTYNPITGESNGIATALSVNTPKGYIDLAVQRSQEGDAPHVLLGLNLDSVILGERIINAVITSGGLTVIENILGEAPPKE